MRIIEHFISIQGEGQRTGIPSLFVRTTGCNLRCCFHNNKGKRVSICDTFYSSFGKIGDDEVPEVLDYDVAVNDCIELLKANPGVRDVVITGGEPMLDQNGLNEFINRLRDGLWVENEDDGIFVTVETNGTIKPVRESLLNVQLWSISPKLKSAAPTEKDFKELEIEDDYKKYSKTDARIKPDILADYVIWGNDVQMKYVYTGTESEQEIICITNDVQEHVDARKEQWWNDHYKLTVNDYVMIMPEGITKKAILDKSDECVQVCIKNGWAFSSRMHILVWGNVREK